MGRMAERHVETAMDRADEAEREASYQRFRIEKLLAESPVWPSAEMVCAQIGADTETAAESTGKHDRESLLAARLGWLIAKFKNLHRDYTGLLERLKAEAEVVEKRGLAEVATGGTAEEAVEIEW